MLPTSVRLLYVGIRQSQAVWVEVTHVGGLTILGNDAHFKKVLDGKMSTHDQK